MENETLSLSDYSNMFEKCVLVKVETDQPIGLDAGDVADIS